MDCGDYVFVTDDMPYDLKSPNYPDKYPPRMNCNWDLVSTSIQISVIRFRTEQNRDKLTITGDTLYGGKSMTFELDGASKIRTIAFNSSVKIHFTSDSTLSYSGFHLRVFSNFSASKSL